MNEYQKNILYIEKFYEGTAVANIGGVLALKVEISYENICKILQEIIRKTASLKLKLNKSQEFYQYEDDQYRIERITVKGGYEDAVIYAEHMMKIPFLQIYDSQLFEIKVIEHDLGKMIFFKLHHLLGDATAITVLCKRFEEGYHALQQGHRYVCNDVPVVYKPVCKEYRIKAGNFFRDKLTDVEPIRLAAKNSRECGAEKITFSMPVYNKYMTSEFVAALYVYLRSVLKTKKIILGFVLGNRKKADRQITGMFANTLPLVLDFDNGRFEELNKTVKREIYNLMRYSSYSFEDLKQSHNIPYDIYEISVSYRYREFLPQIQIGTIVECFCGCLDVPMRISVEEYEDRLDVSIYYKTSLFETEFVGNMGQALKGILQQGIMLNKNVSQIDVLTDLDKEIYGLLNDTFMPHRYHDVIECFMNHITEKETVVWDGGSINGFELEKRCRKIAAYIQGKKAEKIGIQLERSCEMIEAVLGTLMAGAAFMIVSDVISGMESYCDLILHKNEIEEICSNDFKFSNTAYDPESTAYMVCTSGSTGTPKCIEISRKSLMSRLEWADRTFGLTGSILQKTVNTFDVSVWEMLSVIYGSRLCLLQDGYEKFPDKVAQTMLRYEIEKVHFVPSVLRRFIRYVNVHHITFPHLKEVFVSGEKLEHSLVNDFFSSMQGKRLINLYGPAECTIDVTFYECVNGRDPQDIPIGHPVGNTRICILNDCNRYMPIGTYGEICVLGELVGKGYIEAADEHAKKIGENDDCGFVMIDGIRAYKTGDIGKIGFDGNIYISGRKDNQVKVRGIRMNLSYIKNIILKCDGIVDAEVIQYDHRLICYYCGQAQIKKVQEEIAEKASVYVVPSVFRKIDSLPLTESGKTDFLELQKMVSMQMPIENCRKETGKLSMLERALLEETLKYVKVDLDDNLFEAGLDSISILDIVCHFQEKGLNIHFSDFYENVTIRQIAANLKRKKYYTFLKRNNSDTVMICFPFGGGEPQSYQELADKLSCNVIGIYTSAFATDASVEDMVAKLKNILPLKLYKRIYVYGQCVGCMTALEFASQMGRKPNGIILVAPAVRKIHLNKQKVRKFSSCTHLFYGKKASNVFTPWTVLPDHMIAGVLRKAGGKYTYTKTLIQKFRIDTNRFFLYVPRRYHKLGRGCRVSIIFGSEDVFTANRKSIVKKLNRYIGTPLKVYEIKGGRHFINDSHCNTLYNLIKHQYSGI